MNYAESKGYSKVVGVVGIHRAGSPGAIAGKGQHRLASAEVELCGVDLHVTRMCFFCVGIMGILMGADPEKFLPTLIARTEANN